MKSTVTIKDSKPIGSESGIKAKKKKHLGHLNIDETQLPAIKDWKVGEEYEIVIKVKQTGLREVDKWDIEEYGYTPGQVRAEFEILSAGVEDEKEEKEEKSNKYKK